jgi:hypothetical protein
MVQSQLRTSACVSLRSAYGLIAAADVAVWFSQCSPEVQTAPGTLASGLHLFVL